MINFKNIVHDLKEIADKHKQINSFGAGTIEQLIYLTGEIDGKPNDTNAAPIYPLMFVIPNPVTRDEQFITYSLNIVICDVTNVKNYDINLDVYSDTLQMAEDVLAQFKYSVTSADGNYESKYDINLPTTLNPFSESFDDRLTGWTVGVDILVESPLNRCIAPYKPFN